jgi:hypothetical protein
MDRPTSTIWRSCAAATTRPSTNPDGPSRWNPANTSPSPPPKATSYAAHPAHSHNRAGQPNTTCRPNRACSPRAGGMSPANRAPPPLGDAAFLGITTRKGKAHRRPSGRTYSLTSPAILANASGDWSITRMDPKRKHPPQPSAAPPRQFGAQSLSNTSHEGPGNLPFSSAGDGPRVRAGSGYDRTEAPRLRVKIGRAGWLRP